MRIVLVSAAWRRYDVTRLALAQRAHLCGVLAGRGHEATCVIVADDDNLDIAAEHGFHSWERSNVWLGRKFNDGIEYACRTLDADVVVWIGSDDWAHPSLFDRLPKEEADPPDLSEITGAVTWGDVPEVVSGRRITLVNLATGTLRVCEPRGRQGVIPWLIPRKALEPSRFRPVNDRQNIGLDGSLIAGLGVRPEWVFVDPHDHARVDFKSETNLNSYEKITRAIGVGDELDDPWAALADHYPADLVDLARATHERLADPVAA